MYHTFSNWEHGTYHTFSNWEHIRTIYFPKNIIFCLLKMKSESDCWLLKLCVGWSCMCWKCVCWSEREKEWKEEGDYLLCVLILWLKMVMYHTIFNYNNKAHYLLFFSIKSNPKNARVFSLGVYITHKHKTNYKLLWEAG